MRSIARAGCVVLACLVLSACNSKKDSPMSAGPPKRGDLINPPVKLASYSTDKLLTLLAATDQGKILLQLPFTPSCTIDVYQLTYQTVDPKGNITPASGALMVPGGNIPPCTGQRPIAIYAHGTTTDRAFNIARVDTPGNTEGLLLAAVFAAQGYIVVAPNYVGYDTSTLAYHPYLNADQQSKDMIDALTAARTALPVSSAPLTSDNGKLYITGYSQGGYVVMATHSAMQAAAMTVTASGPMSGPYALSAFGDSIFEGQVGKAGPVNLTMLISGYQHAYGNIYTSPTEVFEAKYAAGIETLLPSATPLADLQAQGKIASNALFNSTPPDPAFAAFTPATSPPNLAAVFAAGFGTDNLITNAFRLNYLQDAKNAPDGGVPTLTDGLPPANPTNKLRVDLKTNDLRNWSPAAPVLLCGGDADPTVFYLNTGRMQDYWTLHPPAVAPVVLDVDSAKTSTDPYANLKTGFQAAKVAVRAAAILHGATDGGDMAVLDSYHAGLVPPFCLAAVKSFFDAH